MIRWVAVAALLLALAASACSDEPEFGPFSDVIAHGPAGHMGDAPELEVVTYTQTMDGTPRSCFGLRTDPPSQNDDIGSGSCIDPGSVPELATSVFAHTSGPAPQGLVTRDAAVVAAHLGNGVTVNMTPYRHPDLDAGVFGFSIPDTESVKRLIALDEAGEVLGATNDVP